MDVVKSGVPALHVYQRGTWRRWRERWLAHAITTGGTYASLAIRADREANATVAGTSGGTSTGLSATLAATLSISQPRSLRSGGTGSTAPTDSETTANLQLWANLTTAITDDAAGASTAAALVSASAGDGVSAYKALFSHYEAMSEAAFERYESEIDALTMASNESPTRFAIRLRSLVARFNACATDDDKVSDRKLRKMFVRALPEDIYAREKGDLLTRDRDVSLEIAVQRTQRIYDLAFPDGDPAEHGSGDGNAPTARVMTGATSPTTSNKSKCTYCSRLGHTEAECNKKRAAIRAHALQLDGSSRGGGAVAGRGGAGRGAAGRGGRGRGCGGGGRGGRGGRGGDDGGGRGGSNASHDQCHRCGGHGHWASSCPTSQQQQKQPAPPPQQQQQQQLQASRPQQQQQQQQHSTPASTSMSTKSNRVIVAQPPAWAVDAAVNRIDRRRVIDAQVDPGANAHVVGEVSMLDDVVSLEPPMRVDGLGGATVAIAQGTLRLGVVSRSAEPITLELPNTLVVAGTTGAIIAPKLVCNHMPDLNSNEWSLSKPNVAGKLHTTHDTMTISMKVHNCLYFIPAHLVSGKHVDTTGAVTVRRVGTTPRDDDSMTAHRIGGHLGPSNDCHVCLLTKAKHTHVSARDDNEKETTPLAVVHDDIAGPLPTGVGGERFLHVTVDEATQFVHVYPMQNKSEAPEALRAFIANVGVPCTLRCDNEAVLTSAARRSVVQQHGIKWQQRVEYRPQQAGQVERFIGTVTQIARAMLVDACLPVAYWPHAMRHAAYIKNTTPSRSRSHKGTPHDKMAAHSEARIGKAHADVHRAFVFGAAVYALLPFAKRAHKLAPTATLGVYLGRATNKKAHLVQRVDEERGAVGQPIASIDVSATLTPGGALLKPRDLRAVNHTLLADALFHGVPVSTERHAVDDAKTIDEDNPTASALSNTSEHDEEIDNVLLMLQPVEPAGIGDQSTQEYVTIDVDDEDTTTDDESDDSEVVVRRRTYRVIARDRQRIAEECVDAAADPDGYRAMVQGGLESVWVEAMATHLSELEALNTYEPAAVVPLGATIVGSRWVFATKRNSDGTIARRKARLCAQGFTQVPGVDHDETFSSTVAMTTLRALIATAAARKTRLLVEDIRSAYVNTPLSHTTYMRLPEGFHERFPTGTRALRLRKCLFGLRQSGREWQLLLRSFFQEQGFQHTTPDSAAYVRQRDGAPNTDIVSTFVDDLHILIDCPIARDAFVVTLRTRWATRSADTDVVLGMQLTPTSEGGYYLHQSAYASAIVEEFLPATLRSRIRTTPISSELVSRITDLVAEPSTVPDDTRDWLKTKESKDTAMSNAATELAESTDRYRRIIGKLLFLVRCTRIDMMWAVQFLAKYPNPSAKRPHTVGMLVAYGFLQVLIYINTNARRGIMYSSERLGEVVLHAESDADWASDTETRKSWSGTVLLLGDCPIAWQCRQQTAVAKSSTAAEYVALSNTLDEAAFTRQLLDSLLGLDAGGDEHEKRNPIGVAIGVDNQAAMAWAKREGINRRGKHIDVAYADIKDRVQSGFAALHYVQSAENRADILTKALVRATHERLCARLLHDNE